MTQTVTFTKKDRVLQAFKAGEELTAGQISHRFGVKNVRALVSDLRMNGYPVYCNTGGTDDRGRTRASRYRLGTPMQKVIAAGYQALAAKGESPHI